MNIDGHQGPLRLRLSRSRFTKQFKLMTQSVLGGGLQIRIDRGLHPDTLIGIRV
jgi:hypothetical protein